MKSIFKTIFLFIFLITSTGSLDAATVTWLGGNAAWDDASQWDTGYVPGYGDDVIIPTGRCRIYAGDFAYVRSVEVQSTSARLYIYAGGHLEISGAVDNDALHNMGYVFVLGELAINDVTQTNSSASAKAIKNEYRIYSYSGCIINIKYIDDHGIENTAANSYFRMRGYMSLYSIGQVAIYNKDRFYNYGTIDIIDTGANSLYMILNSDQFRNYSTGVINLNSDIYGGITNNGSSAHIRNYGEMNIENTVLGIYSNGTITNYSGAKLIANDNRAVSFYNRSGGIINNSGTMTSTYSEHGMYNYGTFENNNSFKVWNSAGNGGIMNFSSGIIENNDYIYLSSDTWVDLYNEGEITNNYGAHLAINKTINLIAGSNLTNYGFFVAYGSGFHALNGDFDNIGVIDDNAGELVGQINNNRVIVAPVSGTMQVGVPFANVLDVGTLDDVDISTWKISQTGTSAGTYNETTNEFTPNASAVGISTIYIGIYDQVSGVGRNFSLELANPVTNFQNSKNISSTRNNAFNDDLNQAVAVTIYPNPTSEYIQLTSQAFEKMNSQIQILNATGQIVQQENLIKGATTQTIDLAQQITSGIYFVKIVQEDKIVDTQNIQVNR